MTWLLYWPTRGGVRTLGTMSHGWNRRMVSSRSIQMKHTTLLPMFSFWESKSGCWCREMDSIRWWQPNSTKGGRHHKALRWRWGCPIERSFCFYNSKLFFHIYTLSNVSVKFQGIGTWLTSACTKLEWLTFKSKVLLRLLLQLINHFHLMETEKNIVLSKHFGFHISIVFYFYLQRVMREKCKITLCTIYLFLSVVPFQWDYLARVAWLSDLKFAPIQWI